MSLIYGKTFIAGNAQCRYDPVAISAMSRNIQQLSSLSSYDAQILSGLSAISSYENGYLSSYLSSMRDAIDSISSSILNISSSISTMQQTIDDTNEFMNLNIAQKFTAVSSGPVVYQANVDGWLYCHNVGQPFNVPLVGDPEQYYIKDSQLYARNLPILRLQDAHFTPIKSGTKLCFPNYKMVGSSTAPALFSENVLIKNIAFQNNEYSNVQYDGCSFMFIPKVAQVDFQQTVATFVPCKSYSSNSKISVDLQCCDDVDFSRANSLMVQFEMEFRKEPSSDDVDRLQAFNVIIDALNSQNNRASRMYVVNCRIGKGIDFVKKRIQFEIDLSKFDSFQMYSQSPYATVHMQPFLGLGPNADGKNVEPQEFNLKYRIVDFFDTYEFTPIGADI